MNTFSANSVATYIMYTVLHPKHHTVAIAGPVPKDRIMSVLQEITIWVEIPDPWGPPPRASHKDRKCVCRSHRCHKHAQARTGRGKPAQEAECPLITQLANSNHEFFSIPTGD
jgi:hypothetical protein